MTRVPVVVLAAVLLAGLAAPAPAEARRKKPAVAAQPPAEEAVSPETKATAKEHYTKGETSFAAGRFDEAKTEYEAAYMAWPLDGFLFNIAQCERNLGHTDSAIDYFERYLQTPKAEKNRGEVEAVLSELRRKQAEDKKAVEAKGAADAQAIADAADAKKAADDAAAAKAADDAAKAAEAKRAALVVVAPEPTPAEKQPLYKRKAFWIATVLAAVVVAGGVTGIVLGVDSTHLPPGGSLGVVDWR